LRLYESVIAFRFVFSRKIRGPCNFRLLQQNPSETGHAGGRPARQVRATSGTRAASTTAARAYGKKDKPRDLPRGSSCHDTVMINTGLCFVPIPRGGCAGFSSCFLSVSRKHGRTPVKPVVDAGPQHLDVSAGIKGLPGEKHRVPAKAAQAKIVVFNLGRPTLR